MSSTSNTSFRAATIFTGLLHLAVGLWASIVLSNPAPSSILGAYVITECFFGYFSFLISIFHALLGKRTHLNSLLKCAGLGLFIWNTVLLFDTLGGIPQSPTSPYAYFVFVDFFLTIAVIGVGILAVCCGIGVLLVKETLEETQPTRTDTNAAVSTIIVTIDA